MFFPESRVRVFLCGHPVDARKSFDGLYALVKNELSLDPLSGHLFCFINRRATILTALYWDRSGFCLWRKRLEQGRFLPEKSSSLSPRELDWMGLKMLLEGVVAKRVSTRYCHPQTG